ncbi:hypothetical protein ENSA5_39500 [Enhygromyxa salina]|uniref:DUF3558 domain-containing protein n=1 Tax=Enhygromyxa salina TaxID=215803 RepID=A0A2S9XR82_9BACT|nr:hypothetical protein [Enhygromyxa salina]PRP95365.1 hypothetical protein ENSA5_39500 [Enhygromyxa salina]
MSALPSAPSYPLAAIMLCLACPATVSTPQSEADSKPAPPAGVAVADPDDPRVVRDGEDLYTVDSAPHPAPDAPAPGSGRPDTSNGVCKLFAPKLPEPACCPFETGFDAERIQQLCGHQLYMGESVHQSCGYFFLPDMEGSYPVAIRASQIQHQDPAEAVADHDTRMARTTRNPNFASTPVPGVEGAMWSQANGIHWAFLPGWANVRMVSWTDDACPSDKMPEVLALIAAAKEPPPNAPRPGLVPQARQ